MLFNKKCNLEKQFILKRKCWNMACIL